MYKQNFVVVVRCDGKILREHDSDVVYLPFGSEYSILLKNKDSRRALVDIEVDGENVLNGHKLIVNGNETQEIKGFMRDMSNTNRFKFIHKTEEIQKHRGDKIDDGLIRVTYQFEKYKSEPVVINYISTNTYTPRFSKGLGSHDVYTCSFGSAHSSSNTFGSCSSSIPCSATLPEEGITVKGSEINQNYNYGNIGLLESNIYTIILHLKGLTKTKQNIQKPITIKTKSKCSICGRNNKSINKFCYNCGTFLEQ